MGFGEEAVCCALRYYLGFIAVYHFCQCVVLFDINILCRTMHDVFASLLHGAFL